MKRIDKKNLLLLLLILGIGFAAVSTTLIIKGSATISTNKGDFDIRFTKAILGSDDISSTAISQDGQTLTYGTEDLKELNQTSVLNFTVKNNSSIYDAEVSVSCSTPGEKNEYYTVAALVDGSTTKVIEAKNTKNGTVTVTLIKKSTENISENFSCSLNATAVERNSKAEEPSPNEHIKAIYAYNEDNSECINGTEEGCQEIETPDTYPVGTIIKYEVADGVEKYFNVLHDDGDKLTLQENSNIVSSVNWGSSTNPYWGPVTVIPAVEEATSTWEYVNDMNYSIGFEDSTLGYSSCDIANSVCNIKSFYSIGQSMGESANYERNGVKARIITAQEAMNLGCTTSNNSCRKFLYTNLTDLYQVMNLNLVDNYVSTIVISPGGNIFPNTYVYPYSARAVIEISK